MLQREKRVLCIEHLNAHGISACTSTFSEEAKAGLSAPIRAPVLLLDGVLPMWALHRAVHVACQQVQVLLGLAAGSGRVRPRQVLKIE